jgi:hypothetical protein
LLVSQGLLFTYKRWYGRLTHRPPAIFYESGAFLIADLAPIVTPRDFPADSRVSAVMKRVTINQTTLDLRVAQHFKDGAHWQSIQAEYPNPMQANSLALSTALHAVYRDPIGATRLALATFASYFDRKRLHGELLSDEGADCALSSDAVNWLRTFYDVSDPQCYKPTLTKRWHVFAWPWYWAVLCALAASPLLIFVVSKENFPAAVLIVITAQVFFLGVTVTVDHPTPRYLTTAAWLILLMIGAGLDGATRFAHRRA